MSNNGIQILRERKNQLQNKQKKMKKIALAHNLKITLKNSLNLSLLKMIKSNLVIAVMINTIGQAILKYLHHKAEGHNSNYIIRL